MNKVTYSSHNNDSWEVGDLLLVGEIPNMIVAGETGVCRFLDLEAGLVWKPNNLPVADALTANSLIRTLLKTRTDITRLRDVHIVTQKEEHGPANT